MKLLTVVAVIILGLFIFALIKGPGESVRFIFHGSGLHSADDRVNILLLGNAGGTHAGADLTDTIMVASINQKTNQVYLISLPRDLWLDKIKGKANSVYEISGLGLSKQTIGDVLGLPIHYGVRLNFSGFVKAVNLVEGIDVKVLKSFEDNLYPIEGRENDLCGLEEKEMDFSDEEAKKLNIEPGKRKVLIAKDGKIATDSAEPDKGFQYFPCRYERIVFRAGPTQMDGETSLKFVRSRMGTNEEGSDFARSKRQQLVLESFRGKAFALQTLSSPAKVTDLIKTFGQSVETDIPASDIPALYGLVKRINQTYSFVLSTGSQGFLTNPDVSDYGGAWVLVPKSGRFDEIRQYVKRVLNGEVMPDEQSSRDAEASGSARTGN